MGTAWPSPAHGFWCNAKTYPTTCRYCGKQIFFFSCDCGSKVFFDSLGSPWPVHNCIERVESLLGTEGLARAMSDYMMTPLNWGPNSGVEESYTRKVIQRERQPAPSPPRLVRREPAPGTTAAEVGHVREVLPGVDVFRMLGVPANTLVAYRLLGALAQKSHAQITLHTGDLSREDGESYTCLVPEDLLHGAQATRGDLVFFSLHALSIPAIKCVWVCDAIEKV